MAPAEPTVTEKNLPDQSGKIFIITGATSGIGRELVQILYQRNAKIYLAARSCGKASEVIENIRAQHPSSKGNMQFLQLDLNDLSTIKASAQTFLQKKSNSTSSGTTQLGTNCVAPFLFTKLLTPILAETAKFAAPGSVRVVWVSSSASERFAPENGVDMSNLDYRKDQSAWTKYGASKAAKIFHAREYARRNRDAGIVSVALDPGNLKTDLYRHVPWCQKPVINLVLKEPIYGAYTELYAGLSEEVTLDGTGAWIEPWGLMKSHNRADIKKASKTKGEGGSGIAEEFWEWSDNQVQPFI